MPDQTGKRKIIPVILCGGSGTRLWPLSREESPKQFLKLTGNESLMRQTILRAMRCASVEEQDIVIVTLESLREKTFLELAVEGRCTAHILGEPESRNTAAAVAYAACYVRATFGDEAILWVLPADHYIGDETALKEALKDAIEAADRGKIVTFGITPDSPQTAYGYIKTGEAVDGHNDIHAIDHFTEKPSLTLAEKYLKEGGYLWNSGMFVHRADTIINAYAAHCPAAITPIQKIIVTSAPVTLPPSVYEDMPRLSFDVAIMEHIDNGLVIACDLGWSDVGSWNNIWEISAKDPKGNAISGRVACIESENCLIQSNALLIAAVGLSDLAIIENGDSVFVADRNNPAAMRSLVSALKEMDGKETRRALSGERPWGRYRILNEGKGYTVKEVVIAPGQMQSLHAHNQLCESVTIMQGKGRVYINGKWRTLNPQDHVFLPIMAIHRIENIGTTDFVFLEVQIGSSTDHEDIVRYDDIYGRPTTPLTAVASNDTRA